MTEPVLQLRGISKSFAGTEVVSGIALDLCPGEIHALVGENGAGKSTLIKIMTGVHQPSAGEVLVEGKSVTIPGTQAAQALGVAAIFQEPMVFPDLDVAENIFISHLRMGAFVNWRKMHADARDLVERLGVTLDVTRAASGLTLAEQQTVEITRAISLDVKVLIMDEPTASLSAHEVEQLMKIARTLRDQGVAVLYISHRLEEVFALADKVTVLRDGKHISTNPVSEVTTDSLIRDMVGRNLEDYFGREISHRTGDVLLSVEGLSKDGVFADVRFDVHRGEILCFAGLVGARRTDVALALFGVDPADAGTIRLGGEAVSIPTPRAAMRFGIAYVSEDRRKLGLALPMPIVANISLPTLGRFLNRLGLIKRREEYALAARFRERLNIRTPDLDQVVGRLSGGNQQKVMLSKWLAAEPRLLIVDEPTRGIDVGAKAEVHQIIRDLAAAGVAVIVISSDLPEVMALADRILVMREGRQMGLFDAEAATQEQVMRLATGQSDRLDAA